MNLGAVLVTGLFAGGLSCATVQGGLLAGLVARQRGRTPSRPGAARPPAKAPGRAPTQKVKGATPRKASAARRAGQTTVGQKTSAQTKTGPTKTAPHPAPFRWKAHTVEPPKPLHARLADDFAPVGGFLAGKFVSHTVLGLALGALGGVFQLSVGLRGTFQILAGLLIVVFGLAQLGAPGFKRVRIEPPAVFSRLVRGRTRSESALAPTLLGFTTILIPCGVTLSVEALALTSGSPWAGAATMGVFVLGTSPLFAALGYAARRAATGWSGRFATATGLVVLALGAYTLNGGLTVVDSPLAMANVAQALSGGGGPASTDTVTVAGGRQTAVMTARSSSYSPGNIQVVAGVPTTLLVRSDNVAGCASALVVQGKQYILPTSGDTPIDLGVLQPGVLRYRCIMGMYTGRLTIVPAT